MTVFTMSATLAANHTVNGAEYSADLECDALVRAFGKHIAVDNLSMQVEQGSFFSVLGPSGCGKTTLLRMIAGFERPDSGVIRIRGKDMTHVAPNRRPVNMVFQHLALFPTMTVAENIAYGLKRRKVAFPERARKIEDILERVGLAGLGDRKPDQLSGGQKQRVALARCLVLEPALLLLDEPLGALDLKLREQMKIELKHMQQQFGTTFVYITHDQSEAMVMSDQMAVMHRGRFEQCAPPEEIYHHPKTPFVAGFVGDANRLRGRVHRVVNTVVELILEGGHTVRGHCPSHRPLPGDTAWLYIRPEQIRISRTTATSDQGLPTRVYDCLFDGDRSRLVVELGPQKLSIAVSPSELSRFHAGETVHITLNEHQSRVFSEDTPNG